MKTATEILSEHGINIMSLNDDFNSQLLHAMERYAEEKLKEKEKQIEEDDRQINELMKYTNQKEKECDELKKFPAEWYTKETLHTHLTQNNYSADIADELSELFATSLQGAFRKGWEKGYNDFNPEKSTFNYKYYSELESKQIEELKAEKKHLFEYSEYVNRIVAKGEYPMSWDAYK